MDELAGLLQQYLSPELVFMIPVLIVIGSGLKKSNRVSDTLIPTILCCLGIPIALIIPIANNVEAMNLWQIVVWVLMGIGQGVFLGAASVGVHQLIKQHGEYNRLKHWEYEEKLKKKYKEELIDEGELDETRDI